LESLVDRAGPILRKKEDNVKTAAYKSLADYWKDKKREFIDSCDRCGACMEVCPIISWTQLGKDDSVTAAERFLSFLETGKDAEAIKDFMTSCLKCGYCAEVCSLGPKLHHTAKDFVYSDLEDRGYGIMKVVAELPENPESIWKFFSAISPKPQDRYENWLMKIPENPPQTDLVYYASCATAAFTDWMFDMLNIIKMTGRDFLAISPFDNDLCCGCMHMMSGQMAIAEERSRKLVAALSKFKPKLVVLGCLHTHWWLRDYVIDFAPFDFKVQNEIQFIADNLDRLPFKKRNGEVTVAYHDSCGIGKWTREWDAPRKVLNAIPGVKYVELPRNRNNAACCGLAAPKDLQDKMLCDRLDEVKKAGATLFTSVCVGCNMGYMRHEEKYGISSKNVVCFVAESLGINTKDVILEYTKMGAPDLIAPVVRENIERTAYVNYTEEQTRKLLKRYLYPPRTMGLHDE